MINEKFKVYAIAVVFAFAVHIPLAVYKLKTKTPAEPDKPKRLSVSLIKMTTEQAEAPEVPTPETLQKKQEPKPEIIKKPEKKAIKKKPEPAKKKKAAVKPVIKEQAPEHPAKQITAAVPVVKENVIQTEEKPPEPAKPRFNADAYANALIAEVEANKSYPYMAKRKGHEGIAVVALKLSPGGEAAAVQIARSSGSGILDKEALKLVKSVLPLPNDSEDELNIMIPIRYKLN
ncbi:TonB family protein [Denitrovibrio acetiphilus DSM 12809]|jgi:protein TonB|uniref:TonB family protein n=1 Tax=Denitrovibrio acetiphilus (strain DSM 12809 / NBRC 114555 / N2460) TaxID=522772 RepID=D4H5I7_DENA2|nr:energy transducer TonB [Denitrovibrio acetiphilus]ADD67607.1 TonB family protein [Denitrovibrio acetiphilus DSM 12809]